MIKMVDVIIVQCARSDALCSDMVSFNAACR